MVDEALTRARRASQVSLLRLVMRVFPVLPAAFCAALGAPGLTTDAWADSPVVVEGADRDTREAIEALLPDREDPESLFDAERIAEEAAERAMVWLRSEGYYAAEVTPETSDNPPAARLLINPGPRFRFVQPTLNYTGAPPDAAATQRVDEAIATVRRGEAARAAAVLTAEADAVAALQSSGYPDATADPRRVVVDHATSEVEATYNLAPGQIAHLGGVRAEPNDLFRPSFVSRLQNWDDGDLYSPDTLQRLRRDLTATGAVSVATTRLAPADANGRRDVIVEIEPARRNAYELGVSYSTTEGPGLQAEWTRRNFTRRADALILGTTLAAMQQELSLEWRRPHAAGLGHAVTLGTSLGREDLDAYTRQGVALFGSVDASTRLRTALSYGARLAADQYGDTAGDVSDALVLSTFGNLRRDTTNFSLDPRDGSIVELRVEPTVSTGDATLGFVRGTAEGRIYESFGDDDTITLAARAKIGWLHGVSGDVNDAPPDRRFYAGGGGSVRGYEYNSIYPAERDLLGLTPGGQGAVEGSVEARWRFNARWGAVAFVDAGTAFDDWEDAGDLSFGAGFGVRYDLGFAPLRADIAFPLDDDESNEDFALYISLGQAF